MTPEVLGVSAALHCASALASNKARASAVAVPGGNGYVCSRYSNGFWVVIKESPFGAADADGGVVGVGLGAAARGLDKL